LSKVPIISVIDDDESVRTAMNSLLSSIGMIVHLFESAEDFLRSPYVSDTACLITDVQMTGMSGIELHRFLIAQDQGMPTIFITASPKESIWPRLLKTGVVCLLCKPFDEQALLQCLDTALKRNRDEDVMQ
jgi:FixJ family two-component response regulator